MTSLGVLSCNKLFTSGSNRKYKFHYYLWVGIYCHWLHWMDIYPDVVIMEFILTIYCHLYLLPNMKSIPGNHNIFGYCLDSLNSVNSVNDTQGKLHLENKFSRNQQQSHRQRNKNNRKPIYCPGGIKYNSMSSKITSFRVSADLWFWGVLCYRPQGKVIISEASLCSQGGLPTGGVCPTPSPEVLTSNGSHTHRMAKPGDLFNLCTWGPHCTGFPGDDIWSLATDAWWSSGRYASYWNTFLSTVVYTVSLKLFYLVNLLHFALLN